MAKHADLVPPDTDPQQTEEQWAYIDGDDGKLYIANMAFGDFLSAEQYARKRAEVTGGRVVSRHRIVAYTPWEPA